MESMADRDDGSREERDEGAEKRDLEETLDRERHGSGDYDPEERYGRRDVYPDRSRAEPGDEEEAEDERE